MKQFRPKDFPIASKVLLVFFFGALMGIQLSTLSVCLGSLVAIINLIGVINPSAFGDAARKFPRSLPMGYALTLAGTAWFMWNVSHESLSDFEKLKPILFTLFIGVGLGTCFFVQDFLAVRGTAVILLLLAKLMVDTERWAQSEWRLVIAVWAYVLVIAGMWFTVSPWRLRDILNWATASESRTRIGSALRAAFGVFVAALGFTVFKGS
ncbi:MAG TPA: hypothetical protein VGO67_07615 [Verrucomicrobiae bacterium]